MNKFKWGFIGTGNIARNMAEAILKLDYATLWAVCSAHYDKAFDFAREFGAFEVYNDYQQLIETADIDGLYIATPNSSHFEIAKKALKHGIPVLCEKPICMTMEEFDKLTELANENYACLMEAMWTRFIPSVLKLQNYLENGIIGETQLVEAKFEIDVPFEKNHRLYNKELGGGALLDIGIYGITIADMVFKGFPEFIDLKFNKAPSGVDKNIDVVLIYADGKQAKIRASLDKKGDHLAEIIGDEGLIRVPNFYNPEYFDFETMNGDVIRINVPIEGSPYQYELNEFMRCVIEGELESPLHRWEQTSEILHIMNLIQDLMDSATNLNQ